MGSAFMNQMISVYRYGSIHILKTEIKVGLPKQIKFLHIWLIT